MEVTFNQKHHLYFNTDGLIIPGVSTLVELATGYAYDGVPRYILERAAAHGTAVHEAIEKWEEGAAEEWLPLMVENALDRYKKYKDFEIVKMEQMVHYEERFAGRFDILAQGENGLELIDIKTTAKLDQVRLSWQLSFYKLALGEDVKLKCMWLPRNEEGGVYEVEEIPKEDLLGVLKQYEDLQRAAEGEVPW